LIKSGTHDPRVPDFFLLISIDYTGLYPYIFDMKTRDYLTSEEFDLLFEDELDVLDLDYQFEQYIEEKSAMEAEIAWGK